jgi:quinohemoprotein ethanol dehydrogenase
VATASNLIFQVVNDGRLLVYTAAEGKLLKEIPTGQRGMGPPITYELDGQQYVSFLGGTGQAAPPRVYTLVLDGKTAMP